MGRIETAVVYALENNLVVLTQEDCASIPCPPPQQFHFHQRTAVDLWTILVRTGKVDPRWNMPLTKFCIYTFAKMRLPSLLDVAPSLDKRLGGFLEYPKIEPHKVLEQVLAYLYLFIGNRNRYTDSVKKDTFEFVIREFTAHPTFKKSLFLTPDALTQEIKKIPANLITDELRTMLCESIVNNVRTKRQDVKALHHKYVETFKEELVMKVFHPRKVERWLEEGGFELLDMMF